MRSAGRRGTLIQRTPKHSPRQRERKRQRQTIRPRAFRVLSRVTSPRSVFFVRGLLWSQMDLRTGTNLSNRLRITGLRLARRNRLGTRVGHCMDFTVQV